MAATSVSGGTDVMHRGDKIGTVKRRSDKKWVASGSGYETRGNKTRIGAARALVSGVKRLDNPVTKKKSTTTKRRPSKPKARTSHGDVERNIPSTKGRTGSIALFDADGGRIGSVHAIHMKDDDGKVIRDKKGAPKKRWVGRDAKGKLVEGSPKKGSFKKRTTARKAVARAAGHRNCVGKMI